MFLIVIFLVCKQLLVDQFSGEALFNLTRNYLGNY